MLFAIGTGVSVFSLHPGVVVTELGRHLVANMSTPKLLLFKYVLSPLVCKNPKQGAQTSIHCAVAEGLEEDSGKYFRLVIFLLTLLNSQGNVWKNTIIYCWKIDLY